jgi:hypothetical protein
MDEYREVWSHMNRFPHASVVSKVSLPGGTPALSLLVWQLRGSCFRANIENEAHRRHGLLLFTDMWAENEAMRLMSCFTLEMTGCGLPSIRVPARHRASTWSAAVGAKPPSDTSDMSRFLFFVGSSGGTVVMAALTQSIYAERQLCETDHSRRWAPFLELGLGKLYRTVFRYMIGMLEWWKCLSAQQGHVYATLYRTVFRYMIGMLEWWKCLSAQQGHVYAALARRSPE